MAGPFFQSGRRRRSADCPYLADAQGQPLAPLRIATAGIVFDGSATEKELGMHYRDIAAALEEAIRSYGHPAAQVPVCTTEPSARR